MLIAHFRNGESGQLLLGRVRLGYFIYWVGSGHGQPFWSSISLLVCSCKNKNECIFKVFI